jgi:hypothetical protein
VRHRARRDGNHVEIVGALRQHGIAVVDLASVGNGCPDIATAFGGRTIFMEIKDGRLPPSRRQLTDDERRFFDTWLGKCRVVCSVEDALACWGIGA